MSHTNDSDFDVIELGTASDETKQPFGRLPDFSLPRGQD